MKEDLKFNEAYVMLPVELELRQRSDRGIDRDIKILRSKISQLEKIIKFNTSRLTESNFVGKYINTSRNPIRGFCVLLSQILQNRDLFLKIMKKADGSKFLVYSCILGFAIHMMLTGKDFEDSDFLKFQQDDLKLSVKLYNLLKDKEFEEDFVSLIPFNIVFFINCCDFFKQDLMGIVGKMSEDYGKEKILKSMIDQKDAWTILNKVLKFISIPSNQYDDHYAAMKQFTSRFGLNQGCLRTVVNFFDQVNMLQLTNKMVASYTEDNCDKGYNDAFRIVDL